MLTTIPFASAQEVKAHIETSAYSQGRKCNLIQADLRKKGDSEAKRIVEAHVATYGKKLDVLVNNAGQQITQTDLTKIEMADVESTFQVG